MALLARRQPPLKRSSLRIGGTDSFLRDETINAPDLVWQRLPNGESPLRVWRQFRQVTLEALAAQLNLELSLVSAYERESVPMPDELRARIGTILGIPAGALVRIVERRFTVLIDCD